MGGDHFSLNSGSDTRGRHPEADRMFFFCLLISDSCFNKEEHVVLIL